MNKLLIEASCEVDGVEYHAKAATDTCEGCAFEDAAIRECLAAGPCTHLGRADRSRVIWVRAE